MQDFLCGSQLLFHNIKSATHVATLKSGDEARNERAFYSVSKQNLWNESDRVTPDLARIAPMLRLMNDEEAGIVVVNEVKAITNNTFVSQR
jgi:hypothetical protein